jgi:hypothetical protein
VLNAIHDLISGFSVGIANDWAFSVSIVLPTDIRQDDRIYLAVGMRRSSTGSVPTGYTVLAAMHTIARSQALFMRVANGTEGGTTVTYTYDLGSRNGSAVAFAVVVRGVEGASLGAVEPANPVSLTASGTVRPVLWLAFCSQRGGAETSGPPVGFRDYFAEKASGGGDATYAIALDYSHDMAKTDIEFPKASTNAAIEGLIAVPLPAPKPNTWFDDGYADIMQPVSRSVTPFFLYGIPDEPLLPPTNLNFSNIQQTSMRLTWTAPS